LCGDSSCGSLVVVVRRLGGPRTALAAWAPLLQCSWYCRPSVGAVPVGERAVPVGVVCTPLAAGALLLHPSVGALPVGERAVPVGVLCTPFAARALLLQTFVGAPPSGRMARSARPLSYA